MAIKIRGRVTPTGHHGRIMGRITRNPVPADVQQDYIRILTDEPIAEKDLSGYAAIVSASQSAGNLLGELDFLKDDYVVVLNQDTGFTQILYRPDSGHNLLFVTERCNNRCLMCSQPPREVEDDYLLEDNLRLIDLIPDIPQQLVISGGEPTLLKNGLIQLITKLKDRFPETQVTMLSNARYFAYEDFVEKIASIGHPSFMTAVPLYASTALHHDFIVQAKGAFDQTVHGLYKAAKYGLAVEIRVVLHKQTIPGLLNLADFIYHNLPFVRNIVLMGMEDVGHVHRNWDDLWIHPADYQKELLKVVRYFYHRQKNTYIYNVPLCLLPRELWAFACQSISDYKSIYLSECEACLVKSHCCGLFQSSHLRQSGSIHSIEIEDWSGSPQTRALSLESPS